MGFGQFNGAIMEHSRSKDTQPTGGREIQRHMALGGIHTPRSVQNPLILKPRTLCRVPSPDRVVREGVEAGLLLLGGCCTRHSSAPIAASIVPTGLSPSPVL